jgi:outer membrane protein OmpA-like peptidoglycan-associated protein
VPQSGIFDTRNTSDTQVMKDSIVLYTIDEMIDGGLSVVIKNIFFDFDKYDLKPESMGEIRHLAKFLIANPDLTVQIAGYTDNVGAEQHNQQLSEKRANTVRDALVNLGVAPHKIKAQGYGSTKPISNNDAENRRVEFSILN